MTLSTQVIDEIGWITLSRPDARNAISKAMWNELPIAMAAARSRGARVIVFSGKGTVFAAGADMTELDAIKSAYDARELWSSIRDALNAVAAFPLPTIAMIHGACMGGGCLLACACDFRISEIRAKFSIPVAHLGIVLDEDNIMRLLSLVGRGNATDLLLTGRVIPAREAEQIGLINKTVASAQLKESVLAIAQMLKYNAPQSIEATKKTIACLTGRLVIQKDQDDVIASYLSDEFKQRLKKALGKSET